MMPPLLRSTKQVINVLRVQQFMRDVIAMIILKTAPTVGYLLPNDLELKADC